MTPPTTAELIEELTAFQQTCAEILADPDVTVAWSPAVLSMQQAIGRAVAALRARSDASAPVPCTAEDCQFAGPHALTECCPGGEHLALPPVEPPPAPVEPREKRYTAAAVVNQRGFEQERDALAAELAALRAGQAKL